MRKALGVRRVGSGTEVAHLELQRADAGRVVDHRLDRRGAQVGELAHARAHQREAHPLDVRAHAQVGRVTVSAVGVHALRDGERARLPREAHL